LCQLTAIIFNCSVSASPVAYMTSVAIFRALIKHIGVDGLCCICTSFRR